MQVQNISGNPHRTHHFGGSQQIFSNYQPKIWITVAQPRTNILNRNAIFHPPQTYHQPNPTCLLLPQREFP